MKTPYVSIIMPVYNQEAFLSQALDSILSQTYSHFEVLIIDDGSTDSFDQIIKSYQKKDSRIHCIHQAQHGVVDPRNIGIAQAKGEYICLFDGCDRMLPRRIEIQLHTLLDISTRDIVFTNILLINEKGVIFNHIKGQEFPQEELYARLFSEEVIPAMGSSLLGKRSCFLQEPFNEAFHEGREYECLLRLARSFQFKYIDLPLTQKRISEEPLVSTSSVYQVAIKKILDQYSSKYLEDVVERAPLSQEEKEHLKAKILFRKWLFIEAETKFRNGDLSRFYFHLGNYYDFLGNSEQAICSFEQGTQYISFMAAACWNNLGVVYAKNKEIQKAEESFKKAVELKADYVDAACNLKSLLKGELYSLRNTLREFRTEQNAQLTFEPLWQQNNFVSNEVDKKNITKKEEGVLNIKGNFQNLILCPVGIPLAFDDRYDKENHWRYTKAHRLYETLVVQYSDFVPEENTYDILLKQKGFKWALFKDLLKTFDYSKYEYIGFFDDDLITDVNNINAALTLAKAKGFKLFQLSLAEGSSGSFQILNNKPEVQYTRTNFIEVMGPFIHTSLIPLCIDLWAEYDIFSGWGFDNVLCDLTQEEAAVIHCSHMYHPLRISTYDKSNAQKELYKILYEIFPRFIKNKFNKEWLFQGVQKEFELVLDTGLVKSDVSNPKN